MRSKLFSKTVVLALFLSLLLAACGAAGPFAFLVQPSKRVLFIGNSFTYINGGVDQQLNGLDPSIAVSRIAVGGYSLQDHWNGTDAVPAIHSDKWDYVVLQEQSQTPVFAAAKFDQYAALFNQEIKSAGAQTILFMTWERPDSAASGVTTASLAAAYQSLGARLGVRVAPVGLAFATSLRERPDLPLYVQDGHPTAAGTYLAACIFYGMIDGKSPVGNPYSDSSLSDADRTFLQGVAAAALGY